MSEEINDDEMPLDPEPEPAPMHMPESKNTHSREIDSPSAAPAPGAEKPTVASSPNKIAEPASGKKKKVKKPGRWRRRIIATLVTLIVVIMIVRILLSMLLPNVLRRVARSYGLDCTFERSDLYFFSGDAGLWHVRVTQLDDGKPVAEVGYCRADISPLQLLRGRLVVQRLEADGVDLLIQRDADGTFPLLKRLMAGPKTPPPPPTKSTPIDLTSPVMIDALRLTHVKTHIVDLAVSPALDTTIDMNLRLSDLASPVRPAQFGMEILPTDVLDSLNIEAEGHSGGRVLEATFRMSARGLHPAPLGGYLSQLGIHATAESISMQAAGSISTSAVANDPNALAASIKLKDMAITADGQPALTLKKLTIDADTIGPESAVFASAVLENGTFFARRTADGGLRMAGLEWTPASPGSSAKPAQAPSNPETPSLRFTEDLGHPSNNPSLRSTSDSASRGPAPKKAQGVAAPAPAVDPNAPATAVAMFAPIRWKLGRLTLKQFTATLQDDSVSPAANLQFAIDDLSLSGFVDDVKTPDAPVAITGKFSASNILQQITIAGACRPFSARPSVDLRINATGVRPDALRPYLAAMGIESDLKNGDFSCTLSADAAMSDPLHFSANAKLQDLSWKDGRELLSLEDMEMRGLTLAPGGIRIDLIEMKGPRASARREKSGAMASGGFRLLPHSAASVAPSSVDAGPTGMGPIHAPPAAPQATAIARLLPKIDIGTVRWTGVRVALDDEMVSPATSVSIEDAGVELTDIHVDFDPQAPPAPPGKFHAWLKAPGLAGDVEINGSVAQRSAGASADVEITGKNLSANLAAPYLIALGIQPMMRDGAFHARAHVDLVRTDDGYHANVVASDITLTEGGEEMLGISKAELADVDLKPNLLSIGSVLLDKPRGQLAREETGTLRMANVRLVPVAAVKSPPPRAGVSVAMTLEPSAAGPNAAAPVAIPSMPPAPPMVLVVKKIAIQDGTFGWTDWAVKPAVKTTAHVNGTVQSVTWGKPADPERLSFTLSADEIADEIHIDGTVSATPASGKTSLVISASGLRQGPLASYLPPGTTIDLKDGRFHAKLDASFALVAAGGFSGSATIYAVDYRDGEKGPPLLRFDSAKIAIARVDLPAGIIAIDEITTAGVETSARKSANGSFRAMGLSLGTPATQPVADDDDTVVPAPVMVAAPAGGANAAPAHTVAVRTPAGATNAAPALAVAAPAHPSPAALFRRKYPLVTIAKLDLNLRQLTFSDESRPGAIPMEVNDLRLFARKPIAALGDDPSAPAPADLGISLRVNHVVDSMNLTAQLAPFASQPTVQFDLSATGIHSDGLLALLPELKSQIDDGHLADGRLHVHGEALLRLDRRDPLDFRLTRGCDADVLVKGLEFRDGEKGSVLAGVDEIRSEGIHVRLTPAKKTLVVRTLELTKIVGQAIRENDGIHAVGLVLKMPKPTTQPAAVVAETPKPAAASVARTASSRVTKSVPAANASPAQPVAAAIMPPTTAPASPPAEPNDIRIGRVVVSGIDFRIEDRTVSPPLIVPLNQLDIDVRDLSSRAMLEDRPVRFSALVGAGKVPLPKRPPHTLGGALKEAGAALSGKKTDADIVIEQRDLFSQIQADGVLSFYPRPKGWLKASVSAFDLASLKSEAKEFGVEMSNGVFDSSVDARLPGDGSLKLDCHFIFTDMELSEPPKGPIERFLHLPAPLDGVILLIQDQDGSIDLPLAPPPIRNGHLTSGEILGAVIDAFDSIVVKAIAAAPMKAVNVVTDLAGTFIPGMGPQEPKKEVPIFIAFHEGDDAVGSQGATELSALLKRMKDEPNIDITLRSELGFGDIARAAARANPSPAECLELVSRLTRRKGELTRLRSEMIGRARGDLAARPLSEAVASLEKLHAVERELASTEDGLDRLYDLLRPGAEHQADRRTRQAALDVGQARQQAIRENLTAAGMTALQSRIHYTRPQYNPSGDYSGGRVQITVVAKKKT